MCIHVDGASGTQGLAGEDPWSCVRYPSLHGLYKAEPFPTSEEITKSRGAYATRMSAPAPICLARHYWPRSSGVVTDDSCASGRASEQPQLLRPPLARSSAG